MSIAIRPPIGNSLVVLKAKLLPKADHEFLPAALEIIETPLSPLRYLLTASLCGMMLIALAWSYFGRIDVIATAQGKIQPIGQSKTIQAPITGRIHALFVRNGQRVKAGDPLAELDDSEDRADQAQLMASFQSHGAEAQRRAAALQAAIARSLGETPVIAWLAGTNADLAQREERVLAGDVAQLRSAVASLQSQQQEKVAQRARLQGTLAERKRLVAVLKERVDMRTTLQSRNFGSKANVMDAQENFFYTSATLAAEQGQLREIEASLGSLQADIDKVYSAFVADNAQKLSNAEREAQDAGRKLNKAGLQIAFKKLASPIDGIVQGLSVTTTGQVTTVGEQIMQVVPENVPIEIEAYLPNGDIGFVKEGQAAIVKIDSFPFATYGTLAAEVERIGLDAIPADIASQREENPTASRRNSSFVSAQRVQNLVYPLTLKLDRRSMAIGDKDVPLLPGMAVTVEVTTSKRRILDYFISPMVQIASTALRER